MALTGPRWTDRVRRGKEKGRTTSRMSERKDRATGQKVWN